MRIATTDDIDECARFARAFHSQSIWKDTAFIEQDARVTLLGIINNPDGRIFLTDTGFIGGVLAPVLFNHSKRIAYEMFWYAGENGRDLLTAFEAWAADNKAIPLMVCLEDERVETMARYYKRLGYTPAERYFYKEVT